MRITQLNLPATPEVGLGPLTMDKLGKTVVIAGRNGAGKTRLLKQLMKLPERMGTAKAVEPQITMLRKRLEVNPGDRSEKLSQRLADLEKQYAPGRVAAFDAEGIPKLVPFVPSSLKMADPNGMPKQSLLQSAKQVETPGVQHLADGAFARIQAVQDRMWEATHQRRASRSDEVATATSECERLEEVIEQFLGTTLTRSLDGEAQLFGLPIGRSALSDGQKVVLQLCVAIYAQGATLNDVIIVMDEPENHLHPAALLDLVNTIQSRLSSGQLWIATHSIPLLAEVDPSSIWWMEGNSISKAGDQPARVLAGLLGDEERRHRLAAFLDLPFTLASNRFAAECLFPPAVISARSGDPQTQQIRKVLNAISGEDEPIRILDFGAGKGRLAAELAQSNKDGGPSIVDYIAYEPAPADSEECGAAIARLHGTVEKRLFHDLSKLRGSYDEGTFKVVVMCNVLHEIPPTEWGDLFGADGKITRLLSEDGFLLLVEVQQLPYGERAHQQGFLVLDTPHLRKLFSILEADAEKLVVNEERDGWLKAHLIGRSLVARFTSGTRDAALRDLSSTARDRIRKLRENPGDYRSGRLHGFWVQQFANAQLAIS